VGAFSSTQARTKESVTTATTAPAIAVRPERRLGVLSYLEALTFTFTFEGRQIAPVLIYAEPDPNLPGSYIPIQAEDTGYEGVACVDDTARAALLALAVYEQTGDRSALRSAKRWLSFVLYMQYPDGDFANFVRNANGRRNASGPTSVKGGAWWTGRALWALARAYRVTRNPTYLEAYQRCRKPEAADGKIQALLALGEAELARAGDTTLEPLLRVRAGFIVDCGVDYFRDDCSDPTVHLWGYHQLHALATISRLLEVKDYLPACRRTVEALVEPVVSGLGYYQIGPSVAGTALDSPLELYGSKEGLCAYCLSPLVLGLGELFRATESERYRKLALNAAAWFYGRNDAGSVIYDPTTGLCADGIDGLVVSPNRGAESSIEAGMAEIERLALLDLMEE